MWAVGSHSVQAADSRHHLWHARAPCSQPCLLRLRVIACDADARSRTPAPSALAERRRILIFNACRCPVQLYTAMAAVSASRVSTRSTLVKRTTRRNLWYVCDRHTAHHVRTQTPQQTPQSRSSDQRPVKPTMKTERCARNRGERESVPHQKVEPHAADAASWTRVLWLELTL